MKKTTLLLLVLPLFTLAQDNPGIRFDNLSFSQLLVKAKTEKKLIFVDAFTTWCVPCKQMSSKIFPQKTVGDFFNAKFINAKIDMEKGEGLTIAQKYQVQSYPTYLFINADGKIVHKAIGYIEANEFIRIGEDANNPSRQYYTLKEKYEKGNRDPLLIYDLVEGARKLEDPDAGKIAKDYFKTQKDLLSWENLQLLLELTESPTDEYFDFLVKNEKEAGKIIGYAEVKSGIDNIVLRYAAKQQNEMDPINEQVQAIENIAKNYRPLAAKNMAEEYGLYLALQYEEYGVYEKIALSYTQRNLKDLNSNQLNDIAWNFFLYVDNKSSLEKALVWTLQSIMLNSNSYNNDTAANLYNKLGNKKNAKSYAEKAISLGKAAGENVSETEKLLKTLQ